MTSLATHSSQIDQNTLSWAAGTGSTAYGIAIQKASYTYFGKSFMSDINTVVPQLWYQSPYAHSIAETPYWEESTFPNYPTVSPESGVGLPIERVNLVSALMQWAVEFNLELFEPFFA